MGGHDSVKLNGYTSIWNAQEPENSFAALLAHLRVGHPVVLGLEIDDMFTSASDVDPITAGRAAGVVGGIGSGLLNPTAYAVNPACRQLL